MIANDIINHKVNISNIFILLRNGAIKHKYISITLGGCYFKYLMKELWFQEGTYEIYFAKPNVKWL